MRSRLRFVIAIGLAVVLGGWLVWSSMGGAMETYAGPGELTAKSASLDTSSTTFRLNGKVDKGAPTANEAAELADSEEGLVFTVVDKQNPDQTVKVVYHGTVPDQFKVGREVVVTGEMKGGVFQAKADSLITLCPSKFTDRADDSST
ncbi:MAG: cytochrome c maturation protein CcmE [Thermoleophilia bacterium]